MEYDEQRRALVDHLRRKGMADEAVLGAMAKVPRHLFVPEEHAGQAYDDEPLPIGHGQTISQPLVVAIVTEALKLAGGEIVLEVGTGSGYQAAILAELSHRVITLERDPDLAAYASQRLQGLGYGSVQVITADGSLGWPPEAPYQAIIVSAGAPNVPQALLEQLADGGRLVIPVGSRAAQTLRVITRDGPDFLSSGLGHVRFVPLLGKAGWHIDPSPNDEE